MDYDIVIIGGGMVGATLACTLGDTPLRIAVAESTPAETEWDDIVYDIRVSALTRATQRVFETIGAWEGMVARRVTPYSRMHVWEGKPGHGGAINFDCADIGEPDLGHIVENRVILAALLERMAQFGNVELICPARVASLERSPQQVSVGLEDGRSLTGRLLVGADGARSWVRQQSSIKTTGWSYDQTAVVATIKTERHHQGTAYQRFLPEGPLAFLPMPEGLSSIVWSTTPERAAELVAVGEESFLEELHQAFGDLLGHMEATGPRGAFPLALQHANAYVAERIALAGNAAHAIHPLAGQGLNLGVSDVAALAEIVVTAEREKRDIGDFALLRRYERWRKGDNVSMMAAMDGFKRLFSNASLPLSLLRKTGLNLADASGPLKHMMVKRAM
jgi:2-octaprenylphenol hydroxylase